MDIAVVSMGKTLGKYPILEHCCYSLTNERNFPSEIVLFYFGLKKEGISAEFFDGNLVEEREILNKLKANPPKKIVYYVYMPYIRHKVDFMKKLSKISKLYLVLVPFFWKDKVLKEFPFVKDAYYDGEKGFGINTEDVKIDYRELEIGPYLSSPFHILISKYCPYQCTYCNARQTGLLDRNINILKEELEYLKERGVKRFVLGGNNLTLNKKKFLEICKMMKNLEVEWEGDGRINHMDNTLCLALKESNGTLLFGVESANQEILDKIKKGIKVEQVIEVANRLNKLKVPFRFTFMFGFPWDSHKTFRELVMLRKMVGALNYHCNFMDAYPGAPLFEEMKKLNLVDESKLDFEDFSWANMPLSSTLYLTRNEVEKLMKKVMVHGALSKNVLMYLLKRRKLKEYPSLISKGARLLLSGKRTWKK